jgi:hypothetical protein
VKPQQSVAYALDRLAWGDCLQHRGVVEDG